MTARGLRNNNPGNLRVGNNWIGLATPETVTDEQLSELEFDVFIAPIYGIRALCKTLLTYQKRYALKTIQQIISRYAPSSENNTKSYARHVAHQLGVDTTDEIDLTDHYTMRAMIKAIIKHENGSCPYTHELDCGIVLAGVHHTQ